jgi:hypothetical protein
MVAGQAAGPNDAISKGGARRVGGRIPVSTRN